MVRPFDYIEKLVTDPDDRLVRLLNELDWIHVSPITPRKEYYWHAQGLPYTYGKGQFARQYLSQPLHPIIEEIGNVLTEKLGVVFDVVFLNRYDSKHDHLGWHSDDSPEMSDAHPIVTVSLGAEREIWFRPIHEDQEAVIKLKLQHGSACVMLPGVQDVYQHRIPKHDRDCGTRISLTFRVYVNPTTDLSK